MGDREFIAKVLDLLHDDDFAEMRLIAKRRPLTFSEFKALRMPRDMSTSEAWHVLTAFRRQTSSKLSWKSYQRRGDELWYCTTESMAADLLEIEKKCRTGGSLSLGADRVAYREIYREERVAELRAALARDGEELAERRVRDLVEGNVDPCGAAEVALVNVSRILERLGEYSNRQFDRVLMYELYGEVVKGTAGHVLAPRSRFGDLGNDPEYPTAESVIDKICLLYSGESDERAETHFMVLALSAASLFWDFHPFPSWNALLETVTRGLFFIKAGCELLAYLALGRSLLEWEEGLLRPPDHVVVAWGEEEPDCGEGFDCTAQFASFFSLVAREVKMFESRVEEFSSSRAELLELVAASAGLNARQKIVCRDMVVNPELSIEIEDYRASCGVVYATARADLLKLVDLGLLSKSVHGKAFVFSRSKGFKEALARISR